MSIFYVLIFQDYPETSKITSNMCEYNFVQFFSVVPLFLLIDCDRYKMATVS